VRRAAAIAALFAAAVVAGAAGAAASPAPGSFTSNDPLLNQIWADSVKTARDMVVPGPLTTASDGSPCAINLPRVIIDGVARDRCPYAGDQAVTGMTLLVSTPSADTVLHDMTLWYAAHQNADGSIPASPLWGDALVLIDYNAYWVADLYDYVLYTGDLGLARQVWPNLVSLLDGWYASRIDASGLVVADPGAIDYATIPRRGSTVAYYSAGYVWALRMAVQLAGWLGEKTEAAVWTARITSISAAFGPAFWDPSVGAFLDTTTGPVVHPEDGNAFAVLAGIATLAQARSALDYLQAHEWQPYGAGIADTDVWDGFPWGDQATLRVYPFISYFEVLARYQAGLDSTALALIRREWGYMVSNGPKSTMWETIGPYGGPLVASAPSWDHGWSSGAAPALTAYALGVTPASPGFGTYLAIPHPADLKWAQGTIPTPHGPIQFRWAYGNGEMTATITAPVPGKIGLPASGKATLDGRTLRHLPGPVTVAVKAGTHTLVVKTG
jgi:hypothetical protein